MANILIADDEREIVRLLRIYIEANSNKVFEANDGETALQILKTESIDLAIVDIMMPRKNGYEIIKHIRKNSNMPILIISAKVDLSDRVFGIDLGADDYIAKPFEPLEVAAKVRAALRRVGVQGDSLKEKSRIEVGSLVLDCDECVAVCDGVTMELTKAEYKVLELLMRQPRRVFTKEQIYEYAWENGQAVDDNAIRVIISRLRDKIGSDTIKTIRGLGYRLEPHG
ncbi:MAG: response regulator transcription factor [Oscillospiraceae bacterium]|nr:response regulator transcription factor [Oscillospiraceae bacterium]MDE7170506.1 response regulator transcription factor [Oscillospiraceae bacterium]